jgi:hypothetical protein
MRNSVHYPEDRLSLIALRNMRTGEYMPFEQQHEEAAVSVLCACVLMRSDGICHARKERVAKLQNFVQFARAFCTMWEWRDS